MRSRYCDFLKELSEKEYGYDDISVLLDFIEDFEDEINDKYDEDEVDEVISDLSVLRIKLENWQIDKMVNFNDELKSYLLNEITHFE